MEQSKGPPIGIDLGTAYTRVAVFDGNKFTIIPDHHGNDAMPSYVAFTDSEVLIGDSARNQASQNPTNTIFDIIRLIGRPYSDRSVQTGIRRWPFKVTGTPGDKLLVEVRWKTTICHFSPLEICSMILIQVKENAERKVGATTTDAVITVPVCFTYKQQQAIKQAGLIAGLNILQIISAPAASAMFYSMDGQTKRSNLFANIARSFLQVGHEEYNMIIFDLGAGTLDVFVLTIIENVGKVRATAGDIHLGGSDFDNNMVDHFVSLLENKGLRNIGNIPYGSLISLRTLCEKAKISLSSGTSKVPMKLSPFYKTVNLDSSITESKFCMLTKDLLSKCIDILEKCLRDANIDTNAVNEVILAGGSAKIPWLQSHIGNLFKGKHLNTSDHTETATAYGAALQAFNLVQRENRSTRFLFLQDVTPFSLGMKISGGVMNVFVPKNTSIPTKKEKIFFLPANQTNLLVEIYEGEGSLTSENSFLGKFELFGAHILTENTITVCFEIHENGTLTVTAEEISSKKRDGITLAYNNIEDSQRRVLEALLYKEPDKSTIKASTSRTLTRKMREKETLGKLLSMNSERSAKLLDHINRERSEKLLKIINEQSEKPKEYAIGIDFGTTYSSVAVWHRNGVKIIENEYGSRLTCSSVAFTDSGRLIGDTVHKDQVSTNPTNTIPNIKRLIGRNHSDQPEHNDSNFLPFQVVCGEKNRSRVSVHYKNEDKHFTPEEIAAMILSKMKQIAEAHLNSKVSKAVISVPTSFNDSQRKSIKDAGVIAGLDVLQLLNETTAAAIGYFLHKASGQSSIDKTLLVFDLGGGILDVSIVKIKDGIIRVQAVAGDTNLGGENFDNNMVSYFANKFMEEKKKDISNKPKSLRRLRSACEKAKRVLSTNAQTVVEVDALDEGIDFCSGITRTAFEELNKDLFTRSINCVGKCLDDAMIDKRSIDEVFLIGGSSRIPKMQQLLQDFFKGKELCKSINADEAVVYGAAVQAAILSGNEDRKKLNILEVQEITYSSFGLQKKGGTMINLFISKHTPIPAKKELIFFSCSDNLSSFSINVQECDFESTMVFSVSGIASEPRAMPRINLTFEIDNSGIMNLTTNNTSGKADNEIVISKDNGGLTPKEIEEMYEAEARYKEEDVQHKVRAAALNYLEEFAYKIKGLARDRKVSASDKNRIEKITDDTIEWVETEEHHAGIDEINVRKGQLEDIHRHLTTWAVGPSSFKASRYKAEDEEHKGKAAALNSLENLVYKIRTIARDPGVCSTSKKPMEEAAYAALDFLETSSGVGIDEIDAWITRLQVMSSQIVYLGTHSGS